MAKITIFGGFGFIGSHLTDYLLSCGYKVTVFGHCNTDISNIKKHGDRLRIVQGYFNNSEEVSAALCNAEIVFHLIGNTVPKTSNENPKYDIGANLIPSLELFELCKRFEVKQVIFASSGGTVYGAPKYLPIDETHETFPLCSYGIQKLTIEHYMRLYHSLYGIDMTVLRISNLYGPKQNTKRGQGIIGTYCVQIIKHEPLQVWGDGSVVRDYIFIEDVVEAMEKLIGNAPGFQVYNLGSGVGVDINKLISIFRQVSPIDFEVEYLPGRNFDVRANILNCTKLQNATGWKPKYELADGLKLTLDWFVTQNKTKS